MHYCSFIFFCSTTEKWTSCPSLKVSGRNLTCIIQEGKNDVLFMGQYYFHLVVNNTKTLDSVSSEKKIMSTDIGNCFHTVKNPDRNVILINVLNENLVVHACM